MRSCVGLPSVARATLWRSRCICVSRDEKRGKPCRASVIQPGAGVRGQTNERPLGLNTWTCALALHIGFCAVPRNRRGGPSDENVQWCRHANYEVAAMCVFERLSCIMNFKNALVLVVLKCQH